MFKILKDYFKVRRMRKMLDTLNDLCDAQGSCENCKAVIDGDIRCAQRYVLQQAVDHLEQMKKEYEDA